MNIQTIDISAMKSDAPKRQFLDGLCVPMGTTTLFAVGPGAGKSTSLLNAAVAVSAGAGLNGKHSFFGEIDVSKPRRVCVILAEETSFDLQQKFAHHLKKLDHAKQAAEAGDLMCMSLLEINEKQADPEQVFGPDGVLTNLGSAIFQQIEKFKPDLIIFDTLSAMSACEYLNVGECYKAVKQLNQLATKTGAAIIMTTHITKDSGKPDKNLSHGSMMGMMRGSGALAQATRNSIVMIEAPEGRWSNIELEDGDKLFAATVKGNVDGQMEGEVFPVLRSREEKTFKAMVDGVTLAQSSNKYSNEVIGELCDLLPLVVECAAYKLRPFAENGRMSIAGQYDSLLSSFMMRGSDKNHALKALEDVIATENVSIARTSATGAVLDIKGGIFADPHSNLDPETGKPYVFKKGALSTTDLFEFLAKRSGAGYRAAMRHLMTMGYDDAEAEKILREINEEKEIDESQGVYEEDLQKEIDDLSNN